MREKPGIRKNLMRRPLPITAKIWWQLQEFRKQSRGISMKLDSQNATERELIVSYQSLLKCNGIDCVSIAVGMNDWALSLKLSESCDSKSLIELLGCLLYTHLRAHETGR